MIIATIPTPSITSRTLAISATSRPARKNDTTAPTSMINGHGSWNGCAAPGWKAAISAFMNAAVNASVPIENPT